MKVLISRLELVNLIGKIQGVVSVKPTLPILGNILLEAMNDELILSATDLTVSLRVFCPAKVLEEGAITLPARRFFQLCRELTTPQLQIETTSPEVALVHAGTSHFKINGMHKSEFPSFPNFSDGKKVTLPSQQLKECLSRTAFAAARDDSKQIINGISLEIRSGLLTFIATDGKRVAKLSSPLSFTNEITECCILPLKAVEEMVKILDVKETNTVLILMKERVALEVGSTLLVSKLLMGKYPDVNRIIPQKSPQPISLHRDELTSLLRQVSLFTTENNLAVRFTFLPGELHLSAMSGELGEGKVHMPVNYQGAKQDIAFNPHYFLDVLRHTADETVYFDFTDPYNPGLLTDSSSAEFVIMPMRLE